MASIYCIHLVLSLHKDWKVLFQYVIDCTLFLFFNLYISFNFNRYMNNNEI